MRPPFFALRLLEPTMSQEESVVRRQVEITNEHGFHLRPADKFVRLALKYKADIQIRYKGNTYNGKSILELTTLGAECGTRFELEATGPDAEEAVTALAQLILTEFDEVVQPGPADEPPPGGPGT